MKDSKIVAAAQNNEVLSIATELKTAMDKNRKGSSPELVAQIAALNEKLSGLIMDGSKVNPLYATQSSDAYKGRPRQHIRTYKFICQLVAKLRVESLPPVDLVVAKKQGGAISLSTVSVHVSDLTPARLQHLASCPGTTDVDALIDMLPGLSDGGSAHTVATSKEYAKLLTYVQAYNMLMLQSCPTEDLLFAVADRCTHRNSEEEYFKLDLPGVGVARFEYGAHRGFDDYGRYSYDGGLYTFTEFMAALGVA